MQRKTIYLIVMLVMAVGITATSLAVIGRVAYFNMRLFDQETQLISEAWIEMHPLVFISLKVTIFMASIHMTFFLITTFLSWKEMGVCKCLLYFIPIYVTGSIVAACLFLRGQWVYTSTLMAYAFIDQSLCNGVFECRVGKFYLQLWTDVTAYIIVFCVLVVVYWVMFFLRLRQFESNDGERQLREESMGDINAGKNNNVSRDLSIDNVSNLFI